MSKYVYIIKAGQNFKIGKTNNLEKRIKTIQTGNSNKIKLIRSYAIQDADLLERYLHVKFNRFKVRGEWFSKIDISFIDNIMSNNDTISRFIEDMRRQEIYGVSTEKQKPYTYKIPKPKKTQKSYLMELAIEEKKANK